MSKRFENVILYTCMTIQSIMIVIEFKKKAMAVDSFLKLH